MGNKPTLSDKREYVLCRLQTVCKVIGKTIDLFGSVLALVFPEKIVTVISKASILALEAIKRACERFIASEHAFPFFLKHGHTVETIFTAGFFALLLSITVYGSIGSPTPISTWLTFLPAIEGMIALPIFLLDILCGPKAMASVLRWQV